MSHYTALKTKIEERTAIVAVLGLGYVGLPLAVEFARSGFHVIGVDLSEAKVAAINAGQSYIKDVPDETLAALVKEGRLTATSDPAMLHNADTISICVPTPLNQTRDPDLGYVISAADSIAANFVPGKLVVLESTTYPGTTDELILPRLTALGYQVGEDFFIATSPERVDPANQNYNTRTIPKVIGGATPVCTELAQALYASAVDSTVPVSSTKAAEMTKLLENTFRLVNISLVNEVAMMCDRLGVDVWEVIAAAATKPFGFMAHYPGPGIGGHCIPVDPMYLSWKMKMIGGAARFIELAGEINDTMPLYVVNKVADALNDRRQCLNGARILILGVAYKRDIDDLRESPALAIIQLLRTKGAQVDYNDPYIPTLHLAEHQVGAAEAEAISSVSLDHLADYDCVLIVTDHSSYNWDSIVAASKLVVDTRNATRAVRQGAGDKIVPL